MMDKESITPFVEHLKSLLKMEDRGALAHLRRGLNKNPGEAVEMLRYVVPFLPPEEEKHAAYFTVAALFGMHPCLKGQTIGEAFKALKAQSDSDSLEERFMALLDCHNDDLPGHLRHAVSLFASKGIAVDYEQLLRDTLFWDHENRNTQRAWASHYWGEFKKKDDATNETETDTETDTIGN